MMPHVDALKTVLRTADSVLELELLLIVGRRNGTHTHTHTHELMPRVVCSLVEHTWSCSIAAVVPPVYVGGYIVGTVRLLKLYYFLLHGFCTLLHRVIFY